LPFEPRKRVETRVSLGNGGAPRLRHSVSPTLTNFVFPFFIPLISYFFPIFWHLGVPPKVPPKSATLEAKYENMKSAIHRINETFCSPYNDKDFEEDFSKKKINFFPIYSEKFSFQKIFLFCFKMVFT